MPPMEMAGDEMHVKVLAWMHASPEMETYMTGGSDGNRNVMETGMKDVAEAHGNRAADADATKDGTVT